MSIEILDKVYEEARNLVIAAGLSASGNDRLEKLLPPLKNAKTSPSAIDEIQPHFAAWKEEFQAS